MMELFDAHEQKHIDASLLLAVAMQRGVVLGEAVRIPFARRIRLRSRTPPVADAFLPTAGYLAAHASLPRSACHRRAELRRRAPRLAHSDDHHRGSRKRAHTSAALILRSAPVVPLRLPRLQTCIYSVIVMHCILADYVAPLIMIPSASASTRSPPCVSACPPCAQTTAASFSATLPHSPR